MMYKRRRIESNVDPAVSNYTAHGLHDYAIYQKNLIH